MSRLVPFKCEACGSTIEITAGSAATHPSCPKRDFGKAAPRYLIVAQTVSPGGRAGDGSGTAGPIHDPGEERVPAGLSPRRGNSSGAAGRTGNLDREASR